MADTSALKLINKKSNKFVAQMLEDMNLVAGLRWDDLIIRLEWKKE